MVGALDAGEDKDLVNNSKYKNYAAGVEKALKAFEYTAEWADLIAALGKLGKSLQLNTKFGRIPKAVTVGKRLSQCLHPALPPGVHLKALEVYKLIFNIIGSDHLASTLPLYSMGIFPLLAHAGIRVRSEVMGILDASFLPLGPSLAPCLVAFLNGLLPGFEDGSEFFDRTNIMLEKICDAVGERHFYSCVWHCVLCSPQVRLPALLFILLHYDKNKPLDDQINIIGSSVELMVTGLCLTVDDDQVLAQRHLLDFLCAAFPIHSENLVRTDLVRLIKHTVFVILKRDMSLNRRLFSWLLGRAEGSHRQAQSPSAQTHNEETDITYFSKHSFPLLKEAFQLVLQEAEADPSQTIRLSKLVQNLMDKPLIGNLTLDAEILPILQSFQKNHKSTEKTDENFLALNSLLSSLEPGFLWEKLGKSLLEPETISTAEFCELVLYLFSAMQLDAHINIRSVHLPNFLVLVMNAMENSALEPLPALMKLAMAIVKEVRESRGSFVIEGGRAVSPPPESVVLGKDTLVGCESQSIIENCLLRFLATLKPIIELCCLQQRSSPDVVSDVILNFCKLLKELADFPIFLPSPSESNGSDDSPWVNALVELIYSRWSMAGESGSTNVDVQPVETLLYAVVISETLRQQQVELDGKDLTNHVFLRPIISTESLRAFQYSGFYERMTSLLWNQMDSNQPSVRQDATRLFCMLHGSEPSENSVCENFIIRELTANESKQRGDAAQKFRDMWILARSAGTENYFAGSPPKPFNRALLVMLKSAVSSGSDLMKEISLGWLTDSLQHGDMPRILLLNLLLLLSPSTARVSIQYIQKGNRYPYVNVGKSGLVTLRIPSGVSLFHYANSEACLGDTPEMLHQIRAIASKVEEESVFEETVLGRHGLAVFDEYVSDSSLSESEGSEKIADIVADVVERLLDVVEFEDKLEDLAERDIEPAIEAVHMTPEEDEPKEEEELFHPLHAHFLLYTEGKETELDKANFVFTCLAGLLRMPDDISDILINALCSTKTAPSKESHGTLLEWNLRHLKSIVGKDFLRFRESDEREESPTQHKQYMFLELTINTCLHYLRSYFLNSPLAVVTGESISMNWRCKVSCCEFLGLLLEKLGDQVEEQGSSFASYVSDILVKSKIQKSILHCLMVMAQEVPNERHRFSIDVFQFNARACKESTALLLSYQRALLDLTHGLIRLEFLLKTSVKDKLASTLNPSLSSLVELRLFLLTLLNAFKTQFFSHHLWLRFLIRCLPFLGRSLPSVALHVSEQLGKNIELALEACYGSQKMDEGGARFPINYVCVTLEALAVVWHRCLLASGGTFTAGTAVSESSLPWRPTELISNLFKAFSSTDNSNHISPLAKDPSMINCFASAKAELLGALPHVLSTIQHLWTAVKSNEEPRFPVGLPQHVRRLILDLLNPIAMNHSTNFLSSMALVWLTREKVVDHSAEKNMEYSEEQEDIADLILSIKVLPFENLLGSTFQTFKEPVRVKDISDKDAFPIEISLLQMLHACIRRLPAAMLRTSWSSLLKILSEISASSSSPSIFMAFRLLVEFVQRCFSGEFEDKKISRETQDIFQKLVEALNGTVALQLEQTTWLKRTLAVKSNEASITNGHASSEDVRKLGKVRSMDRLDKSKRGSVSKDEDTKRKNRYSFEALFLLSEHFASTLDAICKSEDRDRLLPTITAVWNNVHPYLKSRNDRNAGNFYVGSKFLASLSHYTYSRNVWRKATLELYVETNFFKMDKESLEQWLVIVDNLMTQDKTSFKDFLGRLYVQQGPSLFTTKEQDYDMRTACLQRLAFAVFSSQIDQYLSSLPEIQERLTETLRLYHIPRVNASVFLCFRVLLLKLSPLHLTSLWPVFVSETLLILMEFEEMLGGESNQKLSSEQIQLFSATTDFLETLFHYPPEQLSQFQMYQWTFASPIPSAGPMSHFIPVAERILVLLQRKLRQVQISEKSSMAKEHYKKELEGLIEAFKGLCSFNPVSDDHVSSVEQFRSDQTQRLISHFLQA